jgi:hypothetical protein
MTNKLPKNGLQALILNHKGDRSYARLSAACGGVPSTVNAQRLATKPIKDFPTAEVLMGLSKGLGVRLIDVLHAAALSVGMPIHAPSDHDLLIPEAGRLPEESRRLLIDTAQNMLWWMEQVDAASEPDQGETLGDTPDNVHHFPEPKWGHATAADAGEAGIDPDLPED